MNANNKDSFSIIVPTFREAKNILMLIERISKIKVNSRHFEVILVDDDSRDGTQEIVENLQIHYDWLRLIVRHDKKGLSESVLEGFAKANYPFLVVMDADLSHPPEKILDMLNALKNDEADFVIGSRYVESGSSDETWPLLRKCVSRFAASVTKWLIGIPVQDPLSGFIAVKKTTYLAGYPLQPSSWKIGLEIIVKCGCKKIKEIPIHFSSRVQGASKLNAKVVLDYIKHIHHLFWFRLVSVLRKKSRYLG